MNRQLLAQQVIIITLTTVPLGLGCAPSAKVDSNETVAARATQAPPQANFDPAAGVIPFPNNLLLSPTTGRVTLPAQCGETESARQLREGVLKYRDGHKKDIFAVLSGFAEVHANKVLILAEEAELAKEIDEEQARQAYQKAKDALAMRGKDMDLDSAQAANEGDRP